MFTTDYELLCDDLMKHYLSPEHYMATKASIKCIDSKITATTIDEYIKLLSEGYINVEIREDLDEYLDELLEDKWFHQWPLVRLEYVLRSIRRKTEISYCINKTYKDNIDMEIKILDSLAKEGWPGAMAKIGVYYLIKVLPECTHESYVCLWIHASRMGYQNAGICLLQEFRSGKYEQLCEELQMFTLEEASNWILKSNGATWDDYAEKLNKWDLETYKKMRKIVKKLQKIISERTFMKETAGKLFWSEGESPYEIKY